jgi:hypothetical protein
MPIRPETLMRDKDGRPLPPADLIARIKRFDSRIDLRYNKVSWDIIQYWGPDDPRRARIQSGDTPEHMAYDIAGHLPITCGLDEAPAYIEQTLRGYTNGEYQSLRETIRRWNEEVVDSQVEDRLRAGIEEDMTKSGPSLGIVNVPVKVENRPDHDEPSPTDEDIPPHEPEGPEAPEPPIEDEPPPHSDEVEEEETPKPRRRPARKPAVKKRK